ncbi:MAG: single-stranded DNA-binding protein [Treponema sp.]|nr:single-stranded DNA-binding protein [Treponema sp.]
MNQTNSIVIDGNLVKDPVLSEPKAGFKVCKMTVAVNRWYKDESGNAVDKVSYFDVDAYANSAEFCNKYAKKGAPIRVVGRLQQDRWTTKDGKTDSKVIVVAEHVEILKRPGSEKIDTEENKGTENQPAVEAQKEALPVEQAAVF